ncbi:Bacterial membrane flanked domain protein [compost metagenome]
MVRIQHVDMKQGPVMRKYRVAAITFSTAAGVHEIPGLDLDTAEAVRNRIVELARLAHEDI